MDMGLYLRVLWRFRLVVAIGFILAISLTVASLVRVGFAHGSVSLSYRQQQTWQSTTRLLVTQEGFPWGRSVFPATSPTTVPSTGNSASSGIEFADPTRFTGLAVLYTQLINGDLIQREIRKVARSGDELGATAVTDPSTSSALPMVDVVSLARTPGEASRVSRAAADLFRSYIADQQASAKIPLDQRVLLQVVSTKVPVLAKGRKKTLAIVAFLAVMIGAVGLAFVLENLRPRSYTTEPAAPEETAPERSVVTEYPERSVLTEHTA
jgi:hypothetical protein